MVCLDSYWLNKIIKYNKPPACLDIRVQLMQSKDSYSHKVNPIQLMNTAILKCKEKDIDLQYEERMNEVSNSPAMSALGIAAKQLAEQQNVSYDQAMIDIFKAVKSLDAIWSDYLMMEGLGQLKKSLEKQQTRH